MKIILELDDNLLDEEVIIRCNSINDNVKNIENTLKKLNSKNNTNCLVFYKDDKEYYLSLDEILFFETESNFVNAHTKDDIYKVNYKLYELEEILNLSFIRISKSSIINIKQILSITKNITSSSIAEFKGTNKKVYISRMYYKPLKERMSERL